MYKILRENLNLVKLILAQSKEQELKYIITYIEYSTTASPEPKLHAKHKG